MKKTQLCLLVTLFFWAMAFGQTPEKAGGPPPLPLHTVEGNSGVFITSTAYMANPPLGGDWLGLPSVSVSGAFIGEKDFQSYGLTQNFFGRLEIGYAVERLGLGDWPDDVFQATGLKPEDRVLLHNVNARLLVIQENDFDCPWMPAVTVGSHFKWNDGIDEIDRDLNGCCDLLGADHDFGTELTVVASKTIANILPRPAIVSAGQMPDSPENIKIFEQAMTEIEKEFK